MKRFDKKNIIIVPDMASFIRDVTEFGNVGALKKRLFSLSVYKMFKLIWINKFNVINILRKDFATGVLLLIEIEILKNMKKKPKYVVLSAQVTDLAFALNNKSIIIGFARVAENLFHLKYGYWTNNLVSLINKIAEWNVKPDVIITSINRFGYEMNPGKEIMESYLKLLDHNLVVAHTPVFDKREKRYLESLSIDKYICS